MRRTSAASPSSRSTFLGRGGRVNRGAGNESPACSKAGRSRTPSRAPKADAGSAILPFGLDRLLHAPPHVLAHGVADRILHGYGGTGFHEGLELDDVALRKLDRQLV